MNKLQEIVEYKREIIIRDLEQTSIKQLEMEINDVPPPHNFLKALQDANGIGIIAEVKRASPSAGVIRAEDFDPVAIACDYASAGVDCISILTDEKYFMGSLDNLKSIRKAVKLPLLRKDFVIDRYQILQGRAAGADAILLIAECLDDAQLIDLMNYTHELGMTALLEIFEPENLPRALAVKPKLLGINNRNLKNFVTSLDQTCELAPLIPQEILIVSESAIKTPADIAKVKQSGAKAVLVGETLMRSGDVNQTVRAFKEV